MGAGMITFLAGWVGEVSRPGRGAKPVLTHVASQGHSRAMDPQLRARAEARLAEAAEAEGIADPRPPYRERLRQLRQARPAEFDRAIQHYEQDVLPALAGEEPLAAWLEYGRFLASLGAAGRVVSVDSHGRASDWNGGAPAAGLVLFIPHDTAADVMVLCQPVSPSAAQHATVKLLVDRQLS